MPFDHLPNGLHLVVQPSSHKGKGILHYGVLDIGNILSHPNYRTDDPIIVHQTPPRIRPDKISDTGQWTVLGMVTPKGLPGALQRVKEALKNPNYDLFGNNCEHFAKYVTQGRRSSDQVTAAVVGAGVIGVIAWLLLKK